MLMSIIRYLPDMHLEPQDFEPDQHIAKDYIGIYNRTAEGEKVVKDNTHAISKYEVESIHNRISAQFPTARIVLFFTAIIPLMLILIFYIRKKTNRNT